MVSEDRKLEIYSISSMTLFVFVAVYDRQGVTAVSVGIWFGLVSVQTAS